MSEQMYTYKRTRLPNGRETYVRVPFDPNDNAEQAAVMPRRAPEFKNGEFPGMGSVAVDRIMEGNALADARRALQDAQDELRALQKERAVLGLPPVLERKEEAPMRFGRVVEP